MSEDVYGVEGGFGIQAKEAMTFNQQGLDALQLGEPTFADCRIGINLLNQSSNIIFEIAQNTMSGIREVGIDLLGSQDFEGGIDNNIIQSALDGIFYAHLTGTNTGRVKSVENTISLTADAIGGVGITYSDLSPVTANTDNGIDFNDIFIYDPTVTSGISAKFNDGALSNNTVEFLVPNTERASGIFIQGSSFLGCSTIATLKLIRI